MLDQKVPSKDFLNRDEFRDKVLGCWTGKNIGGTLGAPMEGTREMLDVKFYTQDLQGKPAPNDDLDLQLIWLLAVEERGVYNLNERILGEYWLSHIVGPWNEYGIGKINMTNGFLPPLSGSVNNDKWKNSNGAWIRSEIWACLFPGAPDEVAEYAWIDACVDHADDGIYAEIFTATLESAAFVESDIRKLINIALARIPTNCRIARSVKLVVDGYEAKQDWTVIRNAIIADSAGLGWFQAPANVAFVVLGLLYGEGDFARSLCYAVNCGDDTDCTGATVGAILGIINGRSKIPQEWVSPIGESIQTVAIDRFHISIPATLSELTERTIRCKIDVERANPTLPRLTDGPTTISPQLLSTYENSTPVSKRVLARSCMEQIYDLPFGQFKVEYLSSPICASGQPLKLRLWFVGNLAQQCNVVHLFWQLPATWSITPAPHQALFVKAWHSALEVEITPGDFNEPFAYVPLELRVAGRNMPYILAIPFQQDGIVACEHPFVNQALCDAENRSLSRTIVALQAVK